MTRYYAIPVGKRALVKDGRLFRWMVNGVQDTIRGPENLEGWSPIDRHDPQLSAPFREAWDQLCEDASDNSVWKCSGCGEEMPGSDANDHQDGVGGEFVCGPVAPVGETDPPDGRYWLVGPGVVRCDGPNHPLPQNPDEYCCPRCDGSGFLNPLGLPRPELWAEDDARLESKNHSIPFEGHLRDLPEKYAGIRIIRDGKREDVMR